MPFFFRCKSPQPPRSPDLQPAELLIAETKVRAYNKLHAKWDIEEINKERAYFALKDAWAEIPQDFVQQCIQRCADECREVLAVDGNYSERILH